MRRIRLGIIGTGIAARDLHWPALRQLRDRYEIVAVANRSLAKALAFADLVGLSHNDVAESIDDILARQDVDAVDLIVPPQANRPLTEAAAEAGKHIIAEKPIANTIEDGLAMIAAAERHGVHLLIAENFRYDAFLAQVKQLVDEKAIGQVFLINWRFLFGHEPDNKYVQTGWRQTPQHPGGFLSDINVHTVNGLRYLAGEITRVHCLAKDVRPWLGGLDTAVFNLQFASGVMGNLVFSNAAATFQPMALSLYGTDGTIDATWDQVVLRQPGRTDQEFSIESRGSYVREYEDFYQVLANNKQPLVTPRDTIQDLAVILAAVESARTGQAQPVDVLSP